MGRLIVGFQFDGLTILGDGLVRLAFVREGIPEVIVGCGVISFQLNRLAILGDGCVGPAFVKQGIPEIAVGLGEVGLISIALRYSAMAASVRPLSSRAFPRLPWASARSGLI